MAIDGNVVINVPTGHLKLKGHPPEVIVSNINDGIEKSDLIPVDAKKAAKDFIKEKIQEILENLENLLELNVPESISEIWPVIIDIIKTVVGG